MPHWPPPKKTKNPNKIYTHQHGDGRPENLFFFFFFLQITRKEKIKASLATVSFKVAPKKIHKSVARLAAVLQHIFLCFLFFFRKTPTKKFMLIRSRQACRQVLLNRHTAVTHHLGLSQWGLLLLLLHTDTSQSVNMFWFGDSTLFNYLLCTHNWIGLIILHSDIWNNNYIENTIGSASLILHPNFLLGEPESRPVGAIKCRSISLVDAINPIRRRS